MRSLEILPQARQDLIKIWRYIAKDNILAANRVGDEIDAAINSLRQTPGIGHIRGDVKIPGYRFKNVFSYAIAYRYDDHTVHGRRNFKRLFRR